MDEKELNGTLGAELGIAENEWDTLGLKRFNDAVREYRESGRMDAKRAEIQAQKEKASANEAESLSQSARMAKDIAVVERFEAICLTNDSELAAKTKGVTGSAKYKIIQQYIFDAHGNQSIPLSDGRVAVVDNRDAAHIAHKAGDEKTARIAKIKELVERAELYAEDYNPMHDGKPHDKFNYFGYYEVNVKYDDATFPVYVNVGKTINDGTYHIYDITKKIGDTAKRINVFERPKPNEGYAQKIDVSSTIISDSAEKSTASAKKVAENSAEGGKSILKSKDITPKVAEESGIEKSIGKLGDGKIESVAGRDARKMFTFCFYAP